MRSRLVLAAFLVVGLTFTGAAVAAPAATDVPSIEFSEAVDDQAEPINPRVEFDSSTDRVWASFAYYNHDGGRVSYIVRANGEDYRWGDLRCCDAREGRFAFSIERRSGHDLGGASYEVLLYVGDSEVARGGFGIRGRGGFDNDNE